MAEILRQPLTPVPLSLSHVDGTMLKSPKSALMKHLESKVKSTSTTSINVIIINTMFFMHLQVNLPDTFGGIANYLLRGLMNHDCKEIYFATNKRVSSSLQDCELDQRGSSSMAYQISRVGEKHPGNWLQALRSSIF